MYRRVECQARRMHEMMARLEVDVVALARLHGGKAYLEARTQCLFCEKSGVCLRWLEQSPEHCGSPTFCPSFPLFQTCRKTS
jgi:hypothetical protein